MNTDQLREKVYQWSHDRGIHHQSTEAKQVEKFCEELSEYITSTFTKDAMDAIGDMVVCLINADYFVGSSEWRVPIFNKTIGAVVDLVSIREYSQALIVLRLYAESRGFDWEECLDMAWNAIKDRKGMMADGKFVKWEDLDSDQKLELTARLEKHMMIDS